MVFYAVGAKAIDDKRTFKIINASDGLIDNSAQTILCTESGRIIVTTLGHINIYDGAKFSYIDSGTGDVYTLEGYTGNYHLYFDKNRRIWLKNKQTVTCVDLEKEVNVHNIKSIFEAEGYMRNVDDMFVDSSGELWIVSEGKLYGKGGNINIPIPIGRQLQDFDATKDKALCFYDNGEVACYNLNTCELEYMSKAYDGESVADYAKTSVIKQHDGKIFQIRNGQKGAILMWLDISTGYWTKIMELNYKLNNMAVYNGSLYIASAYGYWTYNLETGIIRNFRELRLLNGTMLLTDINVLQFDKQGGMWIGTEKRGLLYSRPVPSPFLALTWEDPKANEYAIMMDNMDILDVASYGKNVNCAYKDSRGWTWVGTYTGIKIYKTGIDEPAVLAKKDGLMNEVIHSIVEDDNHNIWASTSNGISCVVIRSDSVLHINSYIESDNVPTDAFFNGRALKVEDDGTIAMQAEDHVFVFNPNFHTLVSSPLHISPQLVKLHVNGNEIFAGTKLEGEEIIDKAVYITRDIHLNYNHNSVGLTFSSLNYYRPIQTYYKVRVLGIQNEWRVLSYYNSDGLVDENGFLHLQLMGLLPGQYKVEVLASMYPNQWEGEPLAININIDEPWWRTTGLYSLLVIVISLLVIFNVVYYNKNYKIKVRKHNEEQEIWKRIKNFARRCDSYKYEILAPVTQETEGDNARVDLDERFVGIMLDIMPEVESGDFVSLHDLSLKFKLPVSEFCEIISANIYKNPRHLVVALRLRNSCEMLKDLDKSIAEISAECGIVSADYYRMVFEMMFGMTPEDYRSKIKG